MANKALSNYPPGLIGLASGELARYSDFTASLVGLQKPPGTSFMKATGLGPANPFNAIGRAFMDHPQYKWLFLVNDDHMYPIDTIPRLLDHNVDVVSGLYFGRIQPFEPIMFDSVQMVENPDVPGAKRKWWGRHIMEKGEKGLMRSTGVGDGCLLIQRRVMEKLSDPWWEYGVSMTDSCDHDIKFSEKVQAAGFGLFCDLDLVVDHIATFAVRPHRDPDGQWRVHLVQGDGRKIDLPAANRDMKIRNEP